jgi:hypothetical protein
MKEYQLGVFFLIIFFFCKTNKTLINDLNMEGFHVVMATNLEMTILSFKKYVAKIMTSTT